MWCHGTVAELLGEAALCRCARMPDAAYVQVTDCYWRKPDIQARHSHGTCFLAMQSRLRIGVRLNFHDPASTTSLV